MIKRENKKKEWYKPELIVMVRNNPKEAVLSAWLVGNGACSVSSANCWSRYGLAALVGVAGDVCDVTF